MRTRSQSREQRPPPPEEPPVVIEPLRIEYPFQEDPPVEPMADTRTMAQLLQAPTEGYEDAILIPEIVANNFELKHGLINLVQNKLHAFTCSIISTACFIGKISIFVHFCIHISFMLLWFAK
ncbi:hypothetical protein Tco_1452669 [Tanacetum coccineum]